VADVVQAGAAGRIGATVELLEISRAWLVDPVAEREGPGEMSSATGSLTP